MFTTYRGDNRKPNVIHQQGFAPKQYFGIVWVKQKIREIFGGDAGFWAFDQIANHNNLYVVATDTMKKGQAFDRGDYIYKIEFPLLAEVRDYAAHGVELRKGGHPFWPVLLTNRYDLEQATVIAVRISRPGFAQEVDFFTPIPGANIVGWKTELSGDDADFNKNFQG